MLVHFNKIRQRGLEHEPQRTQRTRRIYTKGWYTTNYRITSFPSVYSAYSVVQTRSLNQFWC